MAVKEKNDRFQRAEKRGSQRHGTYARSVSRNAADRDNEMLRSIILELLFCIVIPPYGIYRIWSEKQFSPVFRIVGTVIAAFVMFLWFLLILPDGAPEPQPITQSTPQAVNVYSSLD